MARAEKRQIESKVGAVFLPLPRAMPSRVGEDLRLEALRGGAASAAACLLSNPIDVVRCRLQLEGGRSGLFHSTGMASSLPAAMAYNVVMNSTRFALFASLSSNTDRPLTSGLLAGGVAGLVSSPLARLRTLQQAGDHMFASAARATAAAPFSGAGIWSLRNAGHTACIFYLYEAALRRLSVRLDGAGVPPLVLYLSASLCASVTSCLLMNPLDVLATRAFHAPPANAAALAAGFHTPTHLNTPVAAPSTLRTTLRTPARVPLKWPLLDTAYRGLGANLIRTVPHTVLTFVFLEALRGNVPLLPARPALTLPRDTTPSSVQREGLQERRRGLLARSQTEVMRPYSLGPGLTT